MVDLPPPAPAEAQEGEKEAHRPEPRGAFTLVVVFLMFFAAYYLANRWLPGRAWFAR